MYVIVLRCFLLFKFRVLTKWFWEPEGNCNIVIFLCNQSGAVTFNEDRQEAKCGVIKFELKIRLRHGHCEILQLDRTNLRLELIAFGEITFCKDRFSAAQLVKYDAAAAWNSQSFRLDKKMEKLFYARWSALQCVRLFRPFLSSSLENSYTLRRVINFN